MKWFRGLEGARGWLAWMVVVSHILLLTGLSAHLGGRLAPDSEADIAVRMLGDVAVRVFIILSGFVIYHLILEKREPYRAYLTRRFMRIYPVYAVCLVAGIATTFLMFRLLPSDPWGSDLAATPRLYADIASLSGTGRYAHLAAHVLMLHGAIPSNVLFDSEYFFLPPAWSLSLEWQFYLVAPLVAFLIARPRWRIALALTVVAGAWAYNRGWFGAFVLPSFLPGAALLFAVGIMSRIALPALLGRIGFSVSAIILLSSILIFHHTQAHFVIWAILMSYILAQDALDETPVARRLVARVVDTPVAVWFGERSYCTYLLHYPIIQALIYTAAAVGLHYRGMTVFVVIATPILVLIGSDLLHRVVERPGMALGKTWATRMGQRVPAAVQTTS